MNTIVQIALRNVVRHKRRALITAITMMAGIGVFIAVDSLMNGMDRLSVDNMINLSESSVKVFTSAYYADRKALPLDDAIPDPTALAGTISEDPRVSAITRRTEFLARLGNYRDSVPVVGTVVDPVTDPKVFSLTDYISGSYFSSSAQTGGSPDRRIILGAELARKLGVTVGDTVVLSAATRYEASNADDFTLIGLLSTSDPVLNQSTIFITYAAADDFLDLGGLATELDVRMVHRVNLSDTAADAASLAAAIKKQNPDLAPYSFDQLAQGFLTLLKQKRAGSILIIFIILLIAAVGIMNTVLMSVYERIREVGVLKAMGFRSREVVWMFILEGLFVGLLGSLMGAALGGILDALLVFIGFPLDKMAGSLGSGIPFWGRLYGEWNPGAMIFAVIFGVVIALIAAVIPARKAAKMTATDALHFV
jgi:putative ABC transport system permease protein